MNGEIDEKVRNMLNNIYTTNNYYEYSRLYNKILEYEVLLREFKTANGNLANDNNNLSLKLKTQTTQYNAASEVVGYILDNLFEGNRKTTIKQIKDKISQLMIDSDNLCRIDMEKKLTEDLLSSNFDRIIETNDIISTLENTNNELYREINNLHDSNYEKNMRINELNLENSNLEKLVSEYKDEINKLNLVVEYHIDLKNNLEEKNKLYEDAETINKLLERNKYLEDLVVDLSRSNYILNVVSEQLGPREIVEEPTISDIDKLLKMNMDCIEKLQEKNTHTVEKKLEYKIGNTKINTVILDDYIK